jgi:hypothetical protein
MWGDLIINADVRTSAPSSLNFRVAGMRDFREHSRNKEVPDEQKVYRAALG